MVVSHVSQVVPSCGWTVGAAVSTPALSGAVIQATSYPEILYSNLCININGSTV